MRPRLLGSALAVVALLGATGCSLDAGSAAKDDFEKWFAENPIDGVSIEDITTDNTLPGVGSASVYLVVDGAAEDQLPAVTAVCGFDPPRGSEIDFSIALGTVRLPFACEDPAASVTTTLTVYDAVTETGVSATTDVMGDLDLDGDYSAVSSATQQIAPAFRDDPQYGENYSISFGDKSITVQVRALARDHAPLADDTIDVLDQVVELLTTESPEGRSTVYVDGADIRILNRGDANTPTVDGALTALSTGTTKVSLQ